MVISVIGAIISSIVVLVITVAVAAFCARRSLDLDNVAAPIVTAAGDIATLPSLFLATYLIGFRFVTPVIAILCAALAVGSLLWAVRSGLPILRRIVLESFPILVLAGAVDLLAGRDDREAARVVPHVPGAVRARAGLPRGLRVAGRDPRRPDLHQAPPRHARARPRAPGGPRSKT